MAAPLVLGTLDELLEELPGGRDLLEASGHVELTWLPNAFVRDFVIRHEPPASLVAELALVIDQAGAELARFGPVVVRLVPSSIDDRPLLARFRFDCDGNPAFEFALHDLVLGLELTQPWLTRVDPATGQPTGEPLRFEADAMLRVASDGASDVRLYGLTIPPFAIGDTGLIVALQECQLAREGRGVPLSLRGLVGGEAGAAAFDGIYARYARLAWRMPFRVSFAENVGFALDFRDVLLDGSGVSFTLDEHWPVARDPDDPHRLSPASGVFGRLFDGRLRLAFESAVGRVERNHPVVLEAVAWIECAPLFPLLQARFSAARDPQSGEGSIDATLAQEDGTTIDFDLGVGSLTIERLAAQGSLAESQLHVEGSARFTVVLPGWNSGLLDVEAALTLGEGESALRVRLPDVAFGPFGRVNSAEFDVRLAPDAAGAWQLGEFGVSFTFTWRDLATQLNFAAAPPQVPRPPDDAEVIASLRWQQGGGLTLRLEARSGDPSQIFEFLPPAFRPEVRDLAFGFEAHYDDPAAFFAASAGDHVDGRVFAGLRFRPHLGNVLRDDGPLTLVTGDDEGFVAATLSFAVDASGATQIECAIDGAVELDFRIPGLTRDPLISIALTRASLALASSGATATAATTVEMALEGEFAVVPAALSVPAGLDRSLAVLLQPLMQELLSGTVSATLTMRGERAALDVVCQLDRAEIEFDLFDVIAQLASSVVPSRGERDARQDLDVDLDIAFGLRSIRLRLGALDDADGGADLFEFGVEFMAALAGIELTAFARISSDELVLGVEAATLPLALPPFPVAPADLAAFADAMNTWTRPRIDVAILSAEQERDALAGHDDPVSRKAHAALVARLGFLTFLRETWSALGSDDARGRYQAMATQVIATIDAVQGLTHASSTPRLRIESAKLRVPFDDPRLTGVEGTAVLEGFAQGDWLNGLNGTRLTLGLSADQIYFAIEGTGAPIDIPPIGGYDGGEVSLSRLSFGYGFTRNSFAMTFAGTLRLPDRLNEDADLSTRLGFGVRIPQYTALAFRLDIIPVPGPIPVVPVFDFSLDMRSPGTPALLDTQTCTPAFDGLELRIPGVIHADVKALAISPMFGILPAPNVRFDGDLDLGNEVFGLTLIGDEFLVLLGIGASPMPMPIWLLVDPMAPYFDHLCVNVRFAGFGVNFDIERPFPRPNPLLAFAVLALIADPMHPIDPNGALARCIRITLADATVSIPAWARPLIPGASTLARNELNLELNAGTLIGAAQWVARTAGGAFDAATRAIHAGEAELTRIASNPARVAIEDLLTLLPRELRTFHCEISFAGFAASATIILAAPEPGRGPGVFRPPLRKPRRGAIDLLPHDFVPKFKGPVDLYLPTLVDTSASADLLQFDVMSGFDASDIAALPAPPAGAASVRVVASVDVMHAATFRFFGFVADDGSFALSTSLDVAPLRLSIHGISIELPFEFEGRLMLSGRATSSVRRAEVVASGRGRWDVIPGVLRVVAGGRRPVELRIDSRGRFRFVGDGSIEILGIMGLRIEGSIDAGESHLALEGTTIFRIGNARRPLVTLTAALACRVGPGAVFNVEGSGELRVYDLHLVDVGVRVSEREIALRAALSRRRWRIGTLNFDTHLEGEFEGAVRFAPGQAPALMLHGNGTLELLGADIRGALELVLSAASASFAAEGRMRWLGRDWLAARVLVDAAGRVELRGRVSVVLDLTPEDLPFGIQVAGLFLRADLDGVLSFGRNGALATHDLSVDWTLGIRLPGGSANQTFVLAMQKLRVHGNATLNKELVHITGMTFVPLGDVVLPIPTIHFSGSTTIWRAKIALPVIDMVEFMMTTGLKDRLDDAFGIKDAHKLFTIPKDLTFDTEEHTMSELVAAMDFRVSLRWQNGDLGFVIKRGTSSTFVRLADLT